jgi:hypothetical protein
MRQVDVLWADAELESLSCDYDAVRITLRETTGRLVTVQADGPIGFELSGLWDEVIVERGQLLPDDTFSQRCWLAVQHRLGSDVPDSGSAARNTRRFTTLVVRLIDGAELRVAAAEFSTDAEQ